jgi:hypothetical protein
VNTSGARSRVTSPAFRSGSLILLPVVVVAMLAPWILAGCLVKGPPAAPAVPVSPSAGMTPAVVSPDSEAEVPDLYRRTQQSAKRALERRGLRVGPISQESSDEVDEGRVVRSVPAAGEKVPSGTEVRLIISTGTGESTSTGTGESTEPDSRDGTLPVPDVIGLPLAEALDALTGVGFEPRIEEVEAQGRPPGIIVDQVPEAGTRLPISGTVTIVVTRPA